MSRRDAIAAEIDRLVPAIPRHERLEIIDHALSSPGLRSARPSRAAALSLVAYVRHVRTEYEAMLTDGYDIASARHFCRPRIDEVLVAWGGAPLPDDEADS